MGEVKYTEEQRRVIEERDANILVSAAAGSGKTAVLTERIMSLITDGQRPMDIDRMLILTYTKAAAAEMRERISDKINDRLSKCPGDKNLWKQSALLPSAQITTIDSFCLFVIRNNFSDIDIDPGFRIMDEGEKKLLLRNTLSGIFEKHYEDGDSDFRHLIDCYGKAGDDQALMNILIDMYTSVMSNPDPLGWLEKISLGAYDVESIEDICETMLWKSTEQYRNGLVRNMLELANKAVEICSEEDGPGKYLPTMQDLKYMAECLNDESGYMRRYKILNHSEVTKLSSAKTKTEIPEKRALVKDVYKKKIDDIVKELSVFYSQKPEVVISDSSYILKSGRTIAELLKELICTFGEAKRENGMLDFTDMEHYAYKILVKEVKDGQVVPTESALEYRDYFDVVMVDEYQDSNYIQEHILKSISRDDNYFMVGDVKQSIYKFRQACPEIFVDKYNSYSDSGKNVRIDLNKNFRSRQEVLDFANIVFEHTMHTGTASIEYDEKAKLYLGNTEYTPLPGFDAEVLILDKSTKQDSDLFDTESHEGEALLIANKIKELMASGMRVADSNGDGGRTLKYSDIVILLRSTAGWDGIFKKTLEGQGIPTYLNLKSGYFDAVEIRNLLDYLRIIDNPTQDIPLYGSLVSFFGGFGPEEVAQIKAVHKEMSLYKALKEYDEEELKRKVQSFIAQLEMYRDKATYMQVRELIECIIRDTGYLEYVSAMPDGDRKRSNVLMLLERASEFEKSSFHGLFHFNSYIEQLKASEVDYGEAGGFDAGSDMVRIMTIHASKGLEFPVCFLAGVGRGMNTRDASGTVLFDREYGLAFDYYNPDTCEKRKGLQKGLLSRKIELDDKAEEIRVLYVALTRAREKMIVVGEVNDAGKLLGSLGAPNSYTDVDVIGAKTMLDLVMYALADCDMVHKFTRVLSYADIVTDYIEETSKRENYLSTLLSGNYEVDQNIKDMINQRSNYKYPFENLKGMAIKTSVSELKHAAMHENMEMSVDELVTTFETDVRKAYVPGFAGGEANENIGAARGSAMHRLMELLPFYDMDASNEFILGVIEKEKKTGRLSEEYAELILVNKCVDFLGSGLAKRMADADKKGMLHKEQSFFLGIAASRIKPEYPDSEVMLVQGIIDAFFEEEDYVVLMDYKTDAVNNETELTRRYSKQLEIYAEAIERISGKKVREKIIYSFALGREIIL